MVLCVMLNGDKDDLKQEKEERIAGDEALKKEIDEEYHKMSEDLEQVEGDVEDLKADVAEVGRGGGG